MSRMIFSIGSPAFTSCCTAAVQGLCLHLLPSAREGRREEAKGVHHVGWA